MQNKEVRANKRKTRTRSKISGTSQMPRLSVHRTNVAFYAQIIDDSAQKTLLGVSEKELGKVTGTKTAKAMELGKLLAKKAKDAKITKVVFDRGAYQYHGRVKAFAEGAREGGLNF